MAGENALLMSHKGVRTIEWTATEDVAKGDVFKVEGRMGDIVVVFALHDAKMGERCTVVVQADFVQVNTPSGQSETVHWRSPALAGLMLRYTNKFVLPKPQQRQRRDQIAGRLHQDKPADAPVMYVSWGAL